MKTNFLFAIRNINRNRTNSIISVIGLSVAITCCLLIYFFVIQEYNYDNFHEKGNRIYRANYELNYVSFKNIDVRYEREIADLLKEKVPQIEKCTEYRYAFGQVLIYNSIYYDINMSYTNKDFFSMFSFNFIAGDTGSLFENPHEIVITKEFADKIIENKGESYESLIGQTIEFPLDYDDPFTIKGILDDLPKNSCIQFEGIIPGMNGRNFGGCDNSIGYTSIFYLLKENTNPEEAAQISVQQIKDYYKDDIKDKQDDNILVKTDNAFIPFMLPLEEIYQRDDINNCFQSSSDPKNSKILMCIGFLILLIACSNFTILTLGQYIKKIADVGIRKTMGALKRNIFSIFFAESIILTLSAFIIGTGLCYLLIPLFGHLSQTEIHTELINFPKLLIFIVAAFISIVFFISIIPVFVFSKVNPVQLASNKFSIGNKGLISQFFVSFQYSLSIILIIVTIFIVRQANYLKNKSLGLTSENILDIQIDRLTEDEKDIFSNYLKEHPGIINFTKSSRNFVNGSSDSFVEDENGNQITVFMFKVDENYVPTLNLELIAGENFTKEDVKPGSRSMIVNEKFVKMFMIEDDPIGKTFNHWGSPFTIKGVVKNYHYFSTRGSISPAMIYPRQNFGNGYYIMLLKFDPNQVTDVIKHIEKSYKKAAPGKLLTYKFWDEELQGRYEDEDRWSKIIGYAAIIAIVISSLGLFGLTILMINQRIKEIGVRKVNGARITDVLATINKSFVIWLTVSLIIAAPVAYKIVNMWLNSFSNKVAVSWWVFILSGILALIVATMTVSWQSVQAARRNPIEALRYE